MPEKPNVLFVLTDDQDPESISRMENVQRLLVRKGTTFENAFATTSVCCPSRVSFLRGQYAHNHGVVSNTAPEGAYHKFDELGLEGSTVATWLDKAGYDTFYAGKFLNGYKRTTHVPEGFDRWFAFGIGREHRFDDSYRVNENGTLKTYPLPERNETYYVRDRTEAFIRRHEGGGPWLAIAATHAPHTPNVVPPEFEGAYDGRAMPKPPSYDEADVSDRPRWVRELPPVDEDCATDETYLDCERQVVQEWRDRQEALMGVDAMVGDLVAALAETGQLENTYIIFASDNGYSLFRHRVYSKGVIYEEAQGIPLVVRGPGVRRGAVSEDLAANIDLAPTIARWAGVQVPHFVDGRPLQPLLEGAQSPAWRDYLLVEYFRYHPYFGDRGQVYAEHEGGER